MANYIKSTYLLQLEETCKEAGVRYMEKTRQINVDPYYLQEADFNYEIESMPPISNMVVVVVSYLVLTHTYYTKEQMKAFKNLQAYKYFTAGFVDKVGIKLINNYVLLVSKVQHSMRARDPKLRVWVLEEQDGGVCTAHCTCMAGLAEVCSHIAAVLYASEYAASFNQTTTCTDRKSTWPVPSQRGVDPTPVKLMDWGKTSGQKNYIDIPTLDERGIESLLTGIQKEGCQTPLMRIVSPFAEEMSTSKPLLPFFFDLYKKENEMKSLEELVNLDAVVDFNITEQSIRDIEENTRDQHGCEEWYKQRIGRITASTFRKVCHTSLEKPSISLIKSICYPFNTAFTPKAIDWGRKHEDIAVKEYYEKSYSTHTGCVVNKVGLVISRFWPCLGATPNRLVFCECCLGGALEVKCPYILKSGNTTLQDFAKMKETCLVFDEHNNIVLDEKHNYFYQVQAQICICNLKYGDFVIWCPSFLFIQRIYPNFNFWEQNLNKALAFHKKVIMPELLGRYYTRKIPGGCTTRWCFCGDTEDSSMVKCENDHCEIIYFHIKCISLEVVPDSWMCPNCNIMLSHNYI